MTGTPTTMPTMPNSPPPTMMATSTHSPEMPVAPPRMRGAMKLPSTCCTTRMRMQKISACSGSPLSRSSSALGMAPIYGPAMGIMLVTATSTAIMGA